MSAFICSDRHIATIATWYAMQTCENAQSIANELKRLNIRSVNYRYGERNRIKPCFLGLSVDTSPAQIARLCECLDYQSCERPDYKGELISRISALALQKSNGARFGHWSI